MRQCHYTEAGVKFVRDGSNKRVLVLDQPNFDVDVALDNAFSPSFPRKIVTPTSTEWQTLPLTPRRFSAILIASDESCGGCDLNNGSLADSMAINARKGAIRRYFNQGGGLMVGAGADNGNGTGPEDIYYDFVPLPVGGVAVSSPFCLTSLGISLGFEDQQCPDASKRTGTEDDINCCPTHNSFAKPPRGSALRVAELDSEGFAETLVATGRIRGNQIVGEKLDLKIGPKQVVEDERNCFVLTVGRWRPRRGGDRQVRRHVEEDEPARQDDHLPRFRRPGQANRPCHQEALRRRPGEHSGDSGRARALSAGGALLSASLPA